MKFVSRKFRTQADRVDKKVKTFCYQCVAGPDLLTVNVRNGVAVGIEPDLSAASVHPGGGKVCVKAFGIVQKAYHPNRVLTPMKRTNPNKGRHEDPGFVPITWDEAMDIIADKLNGVRATGLLDESGYPRVAFSSGGGGTPQSYMGSLPAFLAAWGPVDFGIGSGQGVKCTHSEHLYGELWHRAFTVAADTPLTLYNVSFGANIEASGGVCGVWRHANARDRGMKRVQIEPALSITGACSAEWVPIRPKTDPAFMYAMIHVALYEHPREALDIPFLKDRTGSPYLIAPDGFFLRDKKTKKPLLWDLKTKKAVPFDTPGTDPALEGTFKVSGLEVGVDGAATEHKNIECRPAFSHLLDHVANCTPEWAAKICDVPVDTIRRVANEFVANAHVGETIEIEGQVLPYRPIAVTLGKTVNNGWGGYECCWARTLLATLFGALEVPGGTLGTTVRLNKPLDDRMGSLAPSPEGFLDYPMNPTDKENWVSRPNIRNAYRTLVPLSGNSSWSPALGPTHLAWMFQEEPPKNLPKPTQPDVWFVYRTNPAISAWDAPGVARKISRFPFVVAFAFTMDETNHMADVLLPDCVDIESTQLWRVGGTKYVEQFWHYHGFALRQAAIEARGESRDFTDIATELAERTGLRDAYNNRINRGGLGVRLKDKGGKYDFSLEENKRHSKEEIWDAVCRAASSELTGGKNSDGLDWYKENGLKTEPFSQVNWYLYPKMVEMGLRFEMPYQERLLRVGKQLANRLHEHGIDWWEKQLTEYQALPAWKDFPGMWEEDARISSGGEDFPFWLLTSRSMQYAWGNNVALQMIKEVADNVAGHGGIIINAGRAAELGIGEGDLIEVRSSLRSTKGMAILRQGIRPDTILMIGQFDHWKTPYAKNLHTPSMNTVTPMSMRLTDATGSSSDLVRVQVRRIGEAA
ncbi:MAG: molybdopterin-dependent oxidoreductase [Rhodobiaceae bacterium]|nr:molybdopterin-dependent oxidoreductase [Rhodobiaceae bacterium]